MFFFLLTDDLTVIQLYFIDIIDECASNPCYHTCNDGPFSYVCSCDSCFTKVGETDCELRQCKINNQCYAYHEVNPSNPCQVHVK